MRELSCFVDESGSDNLRDRYYILALVLHDQAELLDDEIALYERSLRDKGLPDILLHAGPLMTGHEAYEGMELADRKRLLSSFRVFFRNVPVRYACVVLRMSEFQTVDDVEAATRRRLVDFLFDNLRSFRASTM